MSFKPDWEKEYLLQNCEVCGYVQLANLKEDKYGKKQYQLKVLIDEKVANAINDEVAKALDTVKEKYGKTGNKYKMKVRDFERISDVITAKTDKKTGEESIEYAPKGKLVLNLTTNSQNGEYKLIQWDAKKQLITEEKNIYAGSLVSVSFKLNTYTAGKDIGMTIRLQGVQIVKNSNSFVKNTLADCPFDEIEGADDLDDEFIEEECFTDEDVEEI